MSGTQMTPASQKPTTLVLYHQGGGNIALWSEEMLIIDGLVTVSKLWRLVGWGWIVLGEL